MNSNVPSDLKYTKSHEWVKITGNEALIGITDHAQHELTDVVYVELPAPQSQVQARTSCAVVESVKTASDIYAPLSGEVLEANAAVVNNPALINTDPYGQGWFFKVRYHQNAELDQLLSPDAYAALIQPAG